MLRVAGCVCIVVALVSPGFGQDIAEQLRKSGVSEAEITEYLELTGRIETERTRKWAREQAESREKTDEILAQGHVLLCAHNLTAMVLMEVGLKWSKNPRALLTKSKKKMLRLRKEVRRALADSSMIYAQWLKAIYMAKDKAKARGLLKGCADLKVPKM